MGSDDESSSSGSSSSSEASEAGEEKSENSEKSESGSRRDEEAEIEEVGDANVEASETGSNPNELPDLPEDLEEEEPKTLTKTQIMQGRKAQKAATRSLTRSFTTGLMPLSLSARSSDPDVPVESPRFVASARSAKDEDEGEGELPKRRCCQPCFPELRARWARRMERCCWPCLRIARVFADCWEAFEGRCQGLARAILFFCCPLLLLLRILTCGLCRRPPAPVRRTTSLRRDEISANNRIEQHRNLRCLLMTFRKSKSAAQSKSGVMSARSNSFAVARTTSQGSRRSRMTRSSTWGNSRFAEGPPVQPKSQLKERKLRINQQEQKKVQGAKPQTAREEFRQLRRQATQKQQQEMNEAALEDYDPEEEDEDVEILTGWQALIWTDFLPWNWKQTYQVWKESRAEMWSALGPILEKMEQGDDPDSPYPKCLRRRWRVFFLAYWDPFMDSLPTLGRVVTCVLWSLLSIPVSLFVASNILLLMSVLRNLEYVEGNCIIESLPESFVTERGVVTQVVGNYLIRRFYKASPDAVFGEEERLAGSVVQSCSIRVACEHVDLSRTGRIEDDRCDNFQMWAWNDPISCFYRWDDEYGLQSDSLLCLSRPSDLQEEIFGVIISSCVLLLSLLMVAFVWLRRALERRETKRQQIERDEELEKERQEAETIALQQFEEFKKQEGVEEEDEDEAEDLDDLVFAEGTTSLHSRVTRVNGRMTMRGSVSEPVSTV